MRMPTSMLKSYFPVLLILAKTLYLFSWYFLHCFKSFSLFPIPRQYIYSIMSVLEFLLNNGAIIIIINTLLHAFTHSNHMYFGYREWLSDKNTLNISVIKQTPLPQVFQPLQITNCCNLLNIIASTRFNIL